MGLDYSLDTIGKQMSHADSSNLEPTYPALAETVVGAIRSIHPFWDRKNGTDHVFTITYDHGSVSIPASLQIRTPELQQSLDPHC